GMIIVGALISLLVARSRDHAVAAQEREKETGTLYALSQDLAAAADENSVIDAIRKHIREVFQWESVVLLPDGDRLGVQPLDTTGLILGADDIAVATWAFQHGAVAGYDTDTLHGSRLRYIPLASSGRSLGILGVRPREPDGIITHGQERILMAFASQLAQALERVKPGKRE
ncbi:GAF domain-containing protein, partial [Methanoregula sp.]|uniref:GAF domain-containing protein n=1 Tax=Methanoregula sp. TaxID=2052170 RepID=UPI0026393F89